ncbi:hypothetical protein CPSG_05322 [Coccidioides posadasii str. Silveira]|uniref:Uncharacterized protein n=1 Tax=Coccidioides posadasii (strain RMSCC 757 / Silveira) TaxID=443226 RepID=E9D554_COCPS|nr:hypothetical protein CPSG_05322 [Coccidioides posadasii str. Silveira]
MRLIHVHTHYIHRYFVFLLHTCSNSLCEPAEGVAECNSHSSHPLSAAFCPALPSKTTLPQPDRIVRVCWAPYLLEAPGYLLFFVSTAALGSVAGRGPSCLLRGYVSGISLRNLAF